MTNGQIIESSILLDTHVILWSLLQSEELSKSAKNYIRAAQEKSSLLIASITLWEIAMLRSKKRINIYMPIKDFLQAITDIKGIRIVDISAEIAAESVLLTDNFPGDPADRIITATSIIKQATLLTRDKKILTWAQQGNIRAIAV